MTARGAATLPRHGPGPGGAIALYRKFGFETEGTNRAYALRDGRYVDTLSMARLRPKGP